MFNKRVCVCVCVYHILKACYIYIYAYMYIYKYTYHSFCQGFMRYIGEILSTLSDLKQGLSKCHLLFS